ncbi:class I SAM-dependent DNA methyltransferase [Halorubrum sp. AJ67]|uniref:type I restriction-modification system subunit M n=1 Tax=Halorubrum sp. AJ67 TaxID=1173487 RepID=UPI0003DC554D|nr:class I SAM-dependent DNA methyltransferase [Halorubrum sp. AJ67]CDK39491.1 type I restriction-modification system DNA-methyltransferase rmeM [Halorubrum sp. AJ67]
MTLSLSELDSHLFKCADIIRDAVDPTDYKEFILPLVYYKAISDEFEKQYADNLDKYGDEDLARRPNLYDVPVVPEGYGWEDLRAVSDNIDQALNEAFDAVTDQNPELQGVFRADYIDADALDDDRLGKLVEHLSTHDLDRNSVPPDMLGEAYMDLVRQFAEEEGKSGGQFFTPPQIVNLCVRLVDDFEDGQTFHDPTVGSGGMLIEAARYYREEQGGDPEKLKFTGQEINPDIAAIAKMNLSIHGLNGAIEREDSLSKPAFTNEGENELTRFDRVLANFPFSVDWAKDELQDDPYERFDWHEKLPRADRGDYAFIQHIAKQLKLPERDGNGGKAAIVVPHGILFRKNEKRYRKTMLESNLVEAIIGLPENLFQNVSLPTAILILNTNKSNNRSDEVLFVHADDPDFYDEVSNQNVLTEQGIENIFQIYRNWKEQARVSRPVSLNEIQEKDYNLNISLYIETTEPEKEVDLPSEIKKLKNMEQNHQELKNKTMSNFDKFSLE